MKRLMTGVLAAVVALFAITVLSADAAGNEASGGGPFSGTFHGTVYGDNGSRAPLSLVLTQQGDEVEGNVFLGRGLYVDGGFCGAGYLPAAVRSASGTTLSANPRHLDAASTIAVEGYDVTVDLDGDLVGNGGVLNVTATVDLPWLCGGDPVLTGTLYRAA